MRRKVVALITLFVVILIAGCSLLGHEAPPEDIDKAAALFFQRLDKGAYDSIYDDAAKRFKQNQTRQTVSDSLKQLGANGKTVTFSRTTMPTQGEGKDRLMMPAYQVSFEQARGEVSLIFQDEGGEWKLFGFSYKPHS